MHTRQALLSGMLSFVFFLVLKDTISRLPGEMAGFLHVIQQRNASIRTRGMLFQKEEERKRFKKSTQGVMSADKCETQKQCTSQEKAELSATPMSVSGQEGSRGLLQVAVVEGDRQSQL